MVQMMFRLGQCAGKSWLSSHAAAEPGGYRTERKVIWCERCLFFAAGFLVATCHPGGAHANVFLRHLFSEPVVWSTGCGRLGRMQIGMGKVMHATDGFRRVTGAAQGRTLPLTDTGRMSHEPDPCPAAAQHRIVRNRSVKPGHPDQAFDQRDRLPPHSLPDCPGIKPDRQRACAVAGTTIIPDQETISPDDTGNARSGSTDGAPGLRSFGQDHQDNIPLSYPYPESGFHSSRREYTFYTRFS